MSKHYYADTGYACGGLTTDAHGVITETPPIWKKWRGQKLTEWRDWHARQGKLRQLILEEEKAPPQDEGGDFLGAMVVAGVCAHLLDGSGSGE